MFQLAWPEGRTTDIFFGPELQVAQDLADNFPFDDKADDFHLRLTMGADQWVSYHNLL